VFPRVLKGSSPEYQYADPAVEEGFHSWGVGKFQNGIANQCRNTYTKAEGQGAKVDFQPQFVINKPSLGMIPALHRHGHHSYPDRSPFLPQILVCGCRPDCRYAVPGFYLEIPRGRLDCACR